MSLSLLGRGVSGLHLGKLLTSLHIAVDEAEELFLHLIVRRAAWNLV